MSFSSYECVFIVKPDVAAPEVHRLSDKFVEIFASCGANVVNKEFWGLRNLAYEIDKHSKGYYVMLCVNANGAAIQEFERNCKINEYVILFKSLLVEGFSDKPSEMMQAPAKATFGSSLDEMPVKN